MINIMTTIIIFVFNFIREDFIVIFVFNTLMLL